MNYPDFLIVGTARAGTSALNYYLKQHPGIFLPSQKEPCFYSFAEERINYKKGKFAFAVTDKIKYSELFSNASKDKLKGDISTPYLYLHNKTISNIKKYHEDYSRLNIVIILRNPTERAYSQYLWKVRDGREELSFEDALSREKTRMKENYSFDYFYADRGLYYLQVKEYLENFKNVKILLYEDYRNAFGSTMKDLCRFIGADPEFEFVQREKINSASMPKFSAVGKLITIESKIKFKLLNYLPDNVRMSIKEQFLSWNKSSVPVKPISEDTRKRLIDFYRTDILKLQSLTGLNLSSWLNP